MNPDLARDAELERLRRERVEMDERTQRAHEELVALRRRVRQNEEEAAQERVQAQQDLKEVRDRLLAAEEEAEKAAKESEIFFFKHLFLHFHLCYIIFLYSFNKTEVLHT